MIRHWHNIKLKRKPEVVRFDNGRIQQWGIELTIRTLKSVEWILPLATLDDLVRLRRVIDRAIRILSNEGK